MSDPLANHARDLLLANDFPAGKAGEMAAVTLVAAVDVGVPPRGTARALWRFVVERPDSEWARKAADTIGKLALDAEVMTEATNVVRMRDTSSTWFEQAVQVLSGASYASKVRPEVVLAVAERADDSYACYLVVELIRAVHGCSGGLPMAVITAVMSGWGSSNDARRERAPDLAVLLPVTDVRWLKKMLGDPNCTVRRNTARVLGHLPAAEDLLELIDERLEAETYRAVMAALLGAKSEILDRADSPRSARR